MECPACGHDVHVKQTSPRRFKSYDLRRGTCKKCGLTFELREEIVSCGVKNPETLDLEDVPIDDFPAYRDFVNGRGYHPRIGRWAE